MQLKSVILGMSLLASAASMPSQACTGITLRDPSGSPILARTIEWGGSDLNSRYVIVPRGYVQRSYVPGGVKGGLEFKARYGYVGLSVEQEDFVAEGLNEAGLSAGLFYFPRYGSYAPYDSLQASKRLADLQLVPWMLSQFRTVDEALNGLKQVRVTAIDPRASTVHWRIADTSGRQVVVEIVEGRVQVFENKIGVLTNSPGFEWQLTNLNNYVNLFPGSAPAQQLDSLTLQPFGAGSGFLGLPGDVTPPSRFCFSFSPGSSSRADGSTGPPGASTARMQNYALLCTVIRVMRLYALLCGLMQTYAVVCGVIWSYAVLCADHGRWTLSEVFSSVSLFF